MTPSRAGSVGALGSTSLALVAVFLTTTPGPAVAQPGLLGGEFQINTYTPNRQTFPDVAMRGDGQFLIVWHGGSNQDGSAYGVFGRRFTATGAPLAIEFQVNTYTGGSQSYPRAALAESGSFMVVWNSFVTNQDGAGSGVFGRLFNSSGAGVAEFQVNTYTTGDQRRPDVAVDQDGDFIVAWHGPGVAFNAGGIFGQRFDSNGMLQAIEFRIDSYGTLGGGYASIAAHGDGDFVVTWNHGSQDGSVSGIFGQRFDQDAAKVGTDFQVNTVTLSHQNLPRVASDADGDFVVVFNGVDASNTGVLAQRFDSSGARIGGEFLVNTFFTAAQFGGDIGMAGDGTFVIAWQSQGNDGNNYGIFAQTFDSSGSPSGVEFQVNKYTPTSQVNPSAAMAADGDFVIAWMSPKPADTGDILAQRGGEPPVLVTGDIDGNTEVAPLVDGLLVLRHLFGFTNTSLVTGAIGPNCSRCDGPAITAYLTGLGLTLLDADGNGMKDPLTDGLLYLRYLFGFRNDALISNAVGLGCSRCTAMQIADYLDGLV